MNILKNETAIQTSGDENSNKRDQVIFEKSHEQKKRRLLSTCTTIPQPLSKRKLFRKVITKTKTFRDFSIIHNGSQKFQKC